MKKKTALDYAINRADIHVLYRLTTDDHLFIDAHEILEKKALACLLGYAGGINKNLKKPTKQRLLEDPAAWTAIIREDRVKQWQVYADNIRVMEIFNMNK